MLSAKSSIVRRRGFLTGMAAMSVAAGAAAVFARDVSAAPMVARLDDRSFSSGPGSAGRGAVDTSRETFPGARAAQAGEETAVARPTIVLVHGAFAESSSWNGVAAALLKQGYPVVAAANPLRGLRSDADYVASVLAGVQGPVVLVGHSYGGAVISNAVAGDGNVKALVYVSAFAPEAGETAIELSGRFPGSTLGDTLAPPVPLPGGGVDLYIAQDRFHEQFAADVPEVEAQIMAATQRPIAQAALAEASGPPAWQTVPSWFVFGTLDRNIPAAALSFMAERAGAKSIVAIPGASHVALISHPEAVAKVIVEAAAG